MRCSDMQIRFLSGIFFLLFVQIGSAQMWLTDFGDAQSRASTEDKHIILVFQGSDWCAPCIRLDREVWSTAEFREYANTHYIMLKADFPRKKRNALPREQTTANAHLAERYNPQGIFPLVVVLNAEGEVLGKAGYNYKSPEAYIEWLNTLIQS